MNAVSEVLPQTVSYNCLNYFECLSKQLPYVFFFFEVSLVPEIRI